MSDAEDQGIFDQRDKLRVLVMIGVGAAFDFYIQVEWLKRPSGCADMIWNGDFDWQVNPGDAGDDT